MAKKQVKRSSNKNKSKKMQRGGTSSACTLDYATRAPVYGASGAANIHNNNPQASLDLDNKSMMGYGGSASLGSGIVSGGSRKNNKKSKSKSKNNNNNHNMHKGGSNCGSEGVGTSNPKSNTFKEYLTSVDSSLTYPMAGGVVHSSNSHPNIPEKQSGSGYSTDPTSFIGGQPVYKAYDDNSPPALINGSLVFGSPDQPVCGPGAISGGGRRLSNCDKKNRSKKHKNGKVKTNKRSNKNKKNKNQLGGDFTTFNNSKPAEYFTAFNGAPGYFKYPDDMSGRDFNAKQPDYGVNTI